MDEIESDILSDGLAVPSVTGADAAALIDATEKRFAGLDLWGVGRGLKMSDRNIRMGLLLLAGLDATPAARGAGFNGTGSALRSAASKVSRSKRMGTFLQTARQHENGLTESFTSMSDEELDRLQEEIASGKRGGAVQLRAIIECKAERRRKADDAKGRGEDAEHDPLVTLRAIARLSPLSAVVADELARFYNIEFRSADVLAGPEKEAFESAQQAVVARLEGRSMNVAESGSDRTGVAQ